MSDVNQLIRIVKKGTPLNDKILETVTLALRRYKIAVDTSVNWPICCFYIGKLSDISKENYILEDFKNYSSSFNEKVVGCSRGCLPLRELGTKNYLKELCKDCLEEAKRICNIKET